MRYVILAIFVLIYSQAWGEVDGWKDFKFGMSREEVKENVPSGCELIEKKNLHLVKCFNIGGVKPHIFFHFYTNVNELDVIELTFDWADDGLDKPDNYFQNLYDAFENKYGFYNKSMAGVYDNYAFANGSIVLQNIPNLEGKGNYPGKIIYVNNKFKKKLLEKLKLTKISDDDI